MKTKQSELNAEIEAKTSYFKDALENGEANHLLPSLSFKNRYQDKLQKIVTEIGNDPESNSVVGGEIMGSQHSYVLQAVFHLIETDKTNELMALLVENFGNDLSYM